MAILIDQNTRVICQGMTGWAGTHYTDSMMKYGTRVVAGGTSPVFCGFLYFGFPRLSSRNKSHGQFVAHVSTGTWNRGNMQLQRLRSRRAGPELFPESSFP